MASNSTDANEAIYKVRRHLDLEKWYMLQEIDN